MGDLVSASPAHAVAMAAIHAAAFPVEGRWGMDAMALQLVLPGAFGWIDAAGGLVLARVVADEAEVLTLAVAPAARRQGMGRTLLVCAMATAATRGAVTMVLEVGVGNTGARALYAGVGFEQVGLRRGYYAGGEDALIMRTPLGLDLPSG